MSEMTGEKDPGLQEGFPCSTRNMFTITLTLFDTSSSDFYKWGLLKKAASGVPCLRRSGFAQAGRHFSVLTYQVYAPRVKMAVALLDGLF